MSSTNQDRASTLRRRDLIGGAAAGAALASCGGSEGGPAVHTGGKRIQWRMQSSFPSTLDAMFGSAEVFCDQVAAMTDGRFRIRPYQAGEIVPGLEVLDAVQKGSVHMGQTAGYYYIGKAPMLAFETCVPFGLNARQQSAWLDEAGGAELIGEVLADFNCVALAGGNTGTQMGGWFRKEVSSVQDLQGLKMRIPGLGGKVMAELGVSVKSLPGGEIYQALERGAIDATEWVGPYDDQKLGFYEVAKNYYFPGWWEPGPHLSFYVNKDQWEGLPESYRAVLGAASKEAARTMQTRYDARNPGALAELMARDITIRPFADSIMTAARDASEQLLSDAAAGDAAYGKLLAHWRKFRDESFGWFGSAELAYANFAFPGR
ncbi:MAG: TRAP transporter substrate-binding protein DctP [Planctomycetes bacterium]|jgi:TRAP-type mannitol/chloroaromatic compound transport system substrate-binding protein|nr:TRAP transporter substrate-binding protein DctP [Planctomycetota bacterium]